MLSSCTAKKVINTPDDVVAINDNPTQAKQIQPYKKTTVLRRSDSLQYLIEHDTILKNHFVGFSLYDVKDKETMYSCNEAKYFTPASNIKLYTFLAALKIVGHQIPTIEYGKVEDDIVFRGCGDPSFMTQNSKSKVLDILRSTKGKIYYDDRHYVDQRYGSGWAWDDFPYYYQKEKSALPLYGNGYLIQLHKNVDSLVTYPDNAKEWIRVDTSANRAIRRVENSNHINYNPNKVKRNNAVIDIPIRLDSTFVIDEISATLGKKIFPIHSGIHCDYSESVTNHNVDSLYKYLMLYSDNFIADQLMLSCSHSLFDTMDTKRAIAHIQTELFQEMPDSVRWVDGSGLSRYNLITPRSTIWVLNSILDEVPYSFVKEIFPSIHAKGTLQSDFDIPNVYAKTGTLSNNYSLSGYIKTKSGRLYTFSMMHNHYLSSKRQVDVSMRKILNFIYRRY